MTSPTPNSRCYLLNFFKVLLVTLAQCNLFLFVKITVLALGGLLRSTSWECFWNDADNTWLLGNIRSKLNERRSRRHMSVLCRLNFSHMSVELWLHNYPHKWTFEFTVSIFYPATLGVHKMVTQSCKCCTSMSHRFLNTKRDGEIILEWCPYVFS